MLRTGLQTDCHRLANYLECQLSDLIRELFAESKIEEAQDVAYSGCSFIKSLREVCDAQEGGEA